jgi:integrase
VKVPDHLRGIAGKSLLVRGLRTSDLKAADTLKLQVLREFKAKIAEYERAHKAAGDPLEAEALQHRLSKDDEGTKYAIELRAEAIEEKRGYAAAKAFHDLASGRATPLDHHADEFSAHQGYRLKSRNDFQRALGWLRDWLRANNRPLAVEPLMRKDAGNFIGQSLTVGRSAKKAGAYLAFLRQYWKWMMEKGHAAENPWAGQTLPATPKVRRDATPDHGKRPFTDEEVLTLMSGDPGAMMADLMCIAALSGMRLEEICQLQVGDCEGGLFRVWTGKTDNAKRTVPIHSALTDIVARRVAGRKPKEFLFGELPAVTASRETRSDPVAKRFTRYRRKAGVDERPNDKAKSNVDFHSFRRWFIRKARDARLAGAGGFDEWTLTWVIGHTDSDRPKSLELSQHGYAGRDPEAAKRALVEAVRLPLL